MSQTADPSRRWSALRGQRARADDILRSFDVRTAPVDIRAIAAGLGITVLEAPAPGWSGAVEATASGSATIWVAQDEAEIRKRFTIAHEIGHLMFDELGVAHRDASFSGGPMEVRANRFAADLLMPLWLLDGHASRLGTDIDALARLFQVSRQAMEIRLGRWVGKK